MFGLEMLDEQNNTLMKSLYALGYCIVCFCHCFLMLCTPIEEIIQVNNR